MPAWARNARELFYVGSDAFLWSVPVQTTPVFVPGNATRLFEARNPAGVVYTRFYDVTPDGQRFVLIKQASRNSGGPPPNIVVVLNWIEELRAKVGR